MIPDLHGDQWCFVDSPVKVCLLEEVLCADESARLQGLVDGNLSMMGDSLRCTTVTEHVIRTTSEPIKQQHYMVSAVMQRHIDAELHEMLRLRVVEKSNSPWASPIVMVKKAKSDS